MTDVFAAATSDSCVRWALRPGNQFSSEAELKKGENNFERGRFPSPLSLEMPQER